MDLHSNCFCKSTSKASWGNYHKKVLLRLREPILCKFEKTFVWNTQRAIKGIRPLWWLVWDGVVFRFSKGAYRCPDHCVPTPLADCSTHWIREICVQKSSGSEFDWRESRSRRSRKDNQSHVGMHERQWSQNYTHANFRGDEQYGSNTCSGFDCQWNQ